MRKTYYIPLIVLILITTSIVLLYSWQNNWCVDLDSILKIIATSSGVMIATYASINLSRSVASHEESVSLKRKEYSLELIDKYTNPDFISLTMKTYDYDNKLKELDGSGQYNLFKEDADLRKSIITVLNFYENMAVAVKYNLADEDILLSYFRREMNRIYTITKDYIIYKREIESSPSIFIELEEVNLRWQATTPENQ